MPEREELRELAEALKDPEAVEDGQEDRDKAPATEEDAESSSSSLSSGSRRPRLSRESDRERF